MAKVKEMSLTTDRMIRGTEQMSRLLAGENLVIIHQTGLDTAEFDVQTRVLKLPVLDNMSDENYEGYMVHEAGHALHSPRETELRKIAKDLEKAGVPFYFFNVTEDARIEKLLKRRYPGLVRSFGLHYQSLYYIMEVFKHPLGIDVPQWDLIDRINLHCKLGDLVDVPLTDEEYQFVKELEMNCETPDDAVRIAKEIYDYAAAHGSIMSKSDFMASQADAEGDEGNPGSSSDGEGKPSDKDGEGKPGKGKSSSSKKEDDAQEGDASGSGQDKGEKGEKKEGDASGSPSGDGDGEGDDSSDEADGIDSVETPTESKSISPAKASRSIATENRKKASKDEGFSVSALEKALKEKVASYANRTSVNQTYVLGKDFPFMDYVVDVSGGKKKETSSPASRYTDFVKEISPLIGQMVQAFNQKRSADNWARQSFGKTGILDLDRLTKYRFEDDLFKKIAISPKQKNHGYMIMIDWSSSMHSVRSPLMAQVILLTKFWDRLNIPYDVYTFTDGYNAARLSRVNQNCLVPNLNFRCGLIASSRWSVSVRDNILSDYYVGNGSGMGSTPLEPALMIARYLLAEFITRTKVDKASFIFITDGSGNIGFQSTGGGAVEGTVFDQATGTMHSFPSQVVNTASGRAWLSLLKNIFGEKLKTVGFFIGGPLSADASYGVIFNAGYSQIPAAAGREPIKSDPVSGTVWAENPIGYDKMFCIPPKAFQRRSASTGYTNPDPDSLTSDQRINRIVMEGQNRGVSANLSVMAKEFVATTA